MTRVLNVSFLKNAHSLDAAAAQDMQGISDYLRERYPQYRVPAMRKLYRKIQSLKQALYIGRPGRYGLFHGLATPTRGWALPPEYAPA